ncbi:flagellar biosynthetic protein FliQ [Acetobacter sp. AN02]|uniref:flagellar biosynthetic protein FliQ n=1 Tax=Acetobacter sp. AN02 TaxID=2894186 RepID=UPI0024341902|nr:flagellar biosynthetic protein FliQ [Acetobacter sp. AN02]MDG6095085.1 flagellar biosynthetic protein FliQ [Acetobacter sp. AN02]
MNPPDIAALLRETLLVAVKTGAPALAAALAAGLCASIFQSVTQINESTLAFLPKFAAAMLALFLAGSFMYASLFTYTRHIFDAVIAAGLT